MATINLEQVIWTLARIDPASQRSHTQRPWIAMQTLEAIRDQLRKMTDAQLTEHGKTLRKFCRRLPGQKIDKRWLMELDEARAEWRRRHPK
ncbi:MAG: hypothetical protein JO119_09780 [Acidobacteria bacterium]|nr:hypothetical protein [Acidobacteriota bacterium]